MSRLALAARNDEAVDLGRFGVPRIDVGAEEVEDTFEGRDDGPGDVMLCIQPQTTRKINQWALLNLMQISGPSRARKTRLDPV